MKAAASIFLLMMATMLALAFDPNGPRQASLPLRTGLPYLYPDRFGQQPG